MAALLVGLVGYQKLARARRLITVFVSRSTWMFKLIRVRLAVKQKKGMVWMNSGQLNIQRLIRGAILLFFAVLIMSKVENGQALMYIHPRFINTARFAYMVLFVLAIAETLKLKAINTTNSAANGGAIRPFTVAVFIVPIFMGFVVPSTALDSDVVRKKGGLSSEAARTVAGNTDADKASKKAASSESSASNTKDASGAENSKNNGDNRAVQKPETSAEDSGNPASPKKSEDKEEVFEITESNFVFVVDEINNNPDQTIGKVVRLKGFIYKDPDFTSEEFALVRFTVFCCTADATALGLTFKYRAAQALKEDDWYEITGRVTEEKMEIEKMNASLPLLDVLDIKKVDQPKDQYVYPDWSLYEDADRF